MGRLDTSRGQLLARITRGEPAILPRRRKRKARIRFGSWKRRKRRPVTLTPDSLGRVEEVVRAAESSKSKTANVDMTILDHGQQGRVPSPS